MKVLIGFEESGTIRDAFLKQGHDAISCDLVPTRSPGPHHQGDIFEVIDEPWDLFIAHPVCTYLCASGLHWNTKDAERALKTDQAVEHWLNLERRSEHVPKRAFENPVGRINTAVRRPDQYIQPHHYGHDASKKTGLWLKGLPPLRPTRWIEPRWICCGLKLDIDAVGMHGCANCCGDNKPLPRWANQTDSGQNRLGPSDTRARERAETYQGWADAMAAQWGST